MKTSLALALAFALALVGCGGADDAAKGGAPLSASPASGAASAPAGAASSATGAASSPAVVVAPPVSAAQVAASAIAASYKQRIVANGGAISDSDLSAVANFVLAAKNGQYWDKLIDVGPIAGSNLAAALVKLKASGSAPLLLDNHGFAASAYTPEQGLKLGGASSLNTRTNLASLDLQGLFGLSLWLGGGGTAWIGSPNSGQPYSILLGRPDRVEAYIGSCGGGGGFGPDGGTFYHVIKQAISSCKVFVDGRQLGAANETPNTGQLRDAEVEVFRDASDAGHGSFYAIDNGTLSDAEATQFHADVRQLMFGLGRRLAPPTISASGLYTEAQSVQIAPAPTDSALAGAAIHYTLDGSPPTTSSTLYSGPILVARSTNVRAIAVKNGQTSTLASTWVSIVPPGFTTKKYYTAHVMVNLLGFTNDMTQWVRSMKAAGYNLIWAHLDDYQYSYVPTLEALLTAADAVGGIEVMPGPSWWVDPRLTAQMYKDVWNHPSLFRIGGKRVFTGWDYQTFNQAATDAALLQNNIRKSDYSLWVSSRFPFSYDGGATWVGQYVTPDGYIQWFGQGPAGLPMDVGHLYDTRPQLDGLVNFAVDQGGLANTLRTNRLIASTSIERGKFSMGGVSAFYASVSFLDHGFDGAARIWADVLALPPESRPTGMSDTTANDYAELSYMSPMIRPPVDGLVYPIPFSAGFTLGSNVRYPLTDHGGVQAFLRPWARAFLDNAAAPSFTQDRMFAWYWLHPRDVAPMPAVPAIFGGYAHLGPDWWKDTVYAKGAIEVGGTDQVNMIKSYAPMGKIRMAAHLTAPARLKINDSVSELKPAGAAYFEIDMGGFRGKPRFSLVRGNVEVKSGEGPQPITDSIFPGGFDPLVVEVGN